MHYACGNAVPLVSECVFCSFIIHKLQVRYSEMSKLGLDNCCNSSSAHQKTATPRDLHDAAAVIQSKINFVFMAVALWNVDNNSNTWILYPWQTAKRKHRSVQKEISRKQSGIPESKTQKNSVIEAENSSKSGLATLDIRVVGHTK